MCLKFLKYVFQLGIFIKKGSWDFHNLLDLICLSSFYVTLWLFKLLILNLLLYEMIPFILVLRWGCSNCLFQICCCMNNAGWMGTGKWWIVCLQFLCASSCCLMFLLAHLRSCLIYCPMCCHPFVNSNSPDWVLVWWSYNSYIDLTSEMFA